RSLRVGLTYIVGVKRILLVASVTVLFIEGSTL
ncbi:hypothetical protein chiPu_0020802, partial [Chiloscyllium punctatum]|nr:hypothetical protein [Chiloscyllium punctatum]